MSKLSSVRSRIHVFFIQETGRTRAFPRFDDELRIYLVSSAASPRVPLFGGQRIPPPRPADRDSPPFLSHRPDPA